MKFVSVSNLLYVGRWGLVETLTTRATTGGAAAVQLYSAPNNPPPSFHLPLLFVQICVGKIPKIMYIYQEVKTIICDCIWCARSDSLIWICVYIILHLFLAEVITITISININHFINIYKYEPFLSNKTFQRPEDVWPAQAEGGGVWQVWTISHIFF